MDHPTEFRVGKPASSRPVALRANKANATVRRRQRWCRLLGVGVVFWLAGSQPTRCDAQVSSTQGTSTQGTSTQGTSAQGTSAQGTSAQGTSAQGTSTRASNRQSGDAAPTNVLLIVIDDLGWADLGCYGSEYHLSPNIDQLAGQSVRFTQAYAAAPVCSPTRAALLTGKHPARLDMTIWHEGAVEGGRRDQVLREAYSRPNLPREEITIAELVGQHGYVTAHIGKWHLGTGAFYPENQGFDFNIGGTQWGAPATFFYPFRGYWSATNPEPRFVPGLGLGQSADYLPDRLTDEAIQRLSDFRDRPFYLQLWYYSVHSPIEAPAQSVASFRSRPPGRFQNSPEYAAMIQRLDANIGRLLTQLESLGLNDRTAVIVTSDNGGVNTDVRGIVPTSNHPLRAGKGTLYEGGLRVPLLVRWPGQQAATCATPVISEDLFATLVDGLKLTQAPPPHGQDGTSLISLLRRPMERLQRNALYWHFPHYYVNATPCSAIRSDNWKLIHFYETDGCELYDLASDVGETTDLTASHPERASDLRKQLDQWRVSVGANGPIENRTAPTAER